MKEDILGFSPTETEIMHCLWLHGPLNRSELLERLGDAYPRP
jgi:hypothetical protein